MRKRIWLTYIFALLIFTGVMLFKTIRRPASRPGPQIAIPETQDKKDRPENPVPTTTTKEAAEPQPPTPPPVAAAAASPEAAHPNLLAAWQSPIDFYGKVIDENGGTVPGVKVNFQWTELPTERGNRTSGTESDAEGLFSLRGERGPSLSVAISKEGYYVPHNGRWTFNYATGSDRLSPNSATPVVFKLRKKGRGEPLIQTALPRSSNIEQLNANGTPVEVDLLKGERVSAGNGQLTLQFWKDAADKNAKVFSWKCQLSVANGGLIESNEEFPLTAPEKGYQPSILIDMPATNENWQGEIRRQDYILLPDGKCGRIEFRLLSWNGAFTLKSFINPSGSRILEPETESSQPNLPPGSTRVSE